MLRYALMALLLFSSVTLVGRGRVIVKEAAPASDRRVISVTWKGNELCLYQLLALLKTWDKWEVGQDIRLGEQVSAAVTEENDFCALKEGSYTTLQMIKRCSCSSTLSPPLSHCHISSSATFTSLFRRQEHRHAIVSKEMKPRLAITAAEGNRRAWKERCDPAWGRRAEAAPSAFKMQLWEWEKCIVGSLGRGFPRTQPVKVDFLTHKIPQFHPNWCHSAGTRRLIACWCQQRFTRPLRRVLISASPNIIAFLQDSAFCSLPSERSLGIFSITV